MGSELKRRVVLSGVNFVEAGPLAIFKDALQALSSKYGDTVEIIALVHHSGLFQVEKVRYIELPDIKGSWFKRLRFEYFECRELSRNLDADLWLSMHDMTPSVIAKKRAVYCHNPAPFYAIRWREIWLDPGFSLFRLLYGFLYRINIQKNDAVIVQQQWIRSEFQQRYRLRRVVVAHPSVAPAKVENIVKGGPIVFFYPAFARCFKNVELLLEAAAQLSHNGTQAFEVWITIKGDENRYAKWLKRRFGVLSCVRWLGTVSRERVQEIYARTDCLIFPSKLETWGMPLTEFRITGKPILAADLPYAHETLGDYERVQYFATTNSRQLTVRMESFLRGNLMYQAAKPTVIPAPFASDWKELFEYLLDFSENKSGKQHR